MNKSLYRRSAVWGCGENDIHVYTVSACVYVNYKKKKKTEQEGQNRFNQLSLG